MRRRWTDIHDDPNGWVLIEVDVRGVRVVAEPLAETGQTTVEAAYAVEEARAKDKPCYCTLCMSTGRRTDRA